MGRVGELRQRVDDPGRRLGVDDADDVCRALRQRGSELISGDRVAVLGGDRAHLAAGGGEPVPHHRPIGAGHDVDRAGLRSADTSRQRLEREDRLAADHERLALGLQQLREPIFDRRIAGCVDGGQRQGHRDPPWSRKWQAASRGPSPTGSSAGARSRQIGATSGQTGAYGQPCASGGAEIRPWSGVAGSSAAAAIVSAGAGRSRGAAASSARV